MRKKESIYINFSKEKEDEKKLLENLKLLMKKRLWSSNRLGKILLAIGLKHQDEINIILKDLKK